MKKLLKKALTCLYFISIVPCFFAAVFVFFALDSFFSLMLTLAGV